VTVLVTDDRTGAVRDSARMTFPVVTECSKALQPVDRDTFVDGVVDERRAPQPPEPRRRPTDD
jgi:hypothetical protein